VRYSAEKVEQGQALANKLYNAVRFALLRIAEQPGVELAQLAPQPQPATVEDRWILSRLQRVKADLAARIETYDFSHAALSLYDFVYGELCDWYIELVKQRLDLDGPASEAERQALAITLLHVMRETVAMAHPVIPFVTEELWGYLGGQGLLAGGNWPQAQEDLLDSHAEQVLARAIEAITLLRGWRDSVGAKPGLIVPARILAEGYDATATLIARLARLDLVAPNGAGGAAQEQPVAAVAVPGGTVEVLSAQGLDLDAAQRRVQVQRQRLQADIDRVQAKLANEQFVAKAPAQVVQAEREKLARLQAELEAL
jgi:valyl-tRNA synthetase